MNSDFSVKIHGLASVQGPIMSNEGQLRLSGVSD